jgi:hypothetical protein
LTGAPEPAYTSPTMASITSRVLSLGLILLALPGLPGASAK